MTAVYMFSFTGSSSHIVIIPLTDGSCVSVLFYRKWLVLILLSFLPLMTVVYMISFIGSGSHIVIIPLTDGSFVYMLSFYRK